MSSPSFISLGIDVILSDSAAWHFLSLALDPWMCALVILVHHAACLCPKLVSIVYHAIKAFLHKWAHIMLWVVVRLSSFLTIGSVSNWCNLLTSVCFIDVVVYLRRICREVV